MICNVELKRSGIEVGVKNTADAVFFARAICAAGATK